MSVLCKLGDRRGSRQARLRLGLAARIQLAPGLWPHIMDFVGEAMRHRRLDQRGRAFA